MSSKSTEIEGIQHMGEVVRTFCFRTSNNSAVGHAIVPPIHFTQQNCVKGLPLCWNHTAYLC